MSPRGTRPNPRAGSRSLATDEGARGRHSSRDWRRPASPWRTGDGSPRFDQERPRSVPPARGVVSAVCDAGAERHPTRVRLSSSVPADGSGSVLATDADRTEVTGRDLFREPPTEGASTGAAGVGTRSRLRGVRGTSRRRPRPRSSALPRSPRITPLRRGGGRRGR